MQSTADDQAMRSTIELAARRVSLPRMTGALFSTNRISLRKPINVGLMAERAAERFGRVPIFLDQPFAWDPRQRVELDYVECAALIERMSAVLAAAGVRRWDRVAIVKTPNYDVQSLAWAAARIGAIPALLSARLDPDILNILLERLQPKFIVTDPDVARHARLDAARLRELKCVAIGGVEGGLQVEDLWAADAPVPNPLKHDEPMMITHTSSTTGVSKMAEASATGVTFSALMESIFPFAHGPRELFASVISHVHVRAAVTQMASFSRGTPLLGIGTSDDDTIAAMLSRYRPTILEAHPNAFVRWEELTGDPRQPFGSVRLFFNTFDAIHPRTIRRMLDASQRSFPIWVQCYGMTETQVVTARVLTKRAARRTDGHGSRNVGWAVPGVRVRIADPATGERRRSQRSPGMIQVNTRARSLSFVGTPEKFSERRHGKWFDTGDWGRLTRVRQIEVLDRVADRIDGVDSCLAIEDVLLDRIPDAEEIVVVPGEHGKPVAVVCMRDGRALTDDEWAAASAGLTGLDRPFEVTPDQLQRTATVKARRYLLSEMITAGARSREAMRPEVVLRDGA